MNIATHDYRIPFGTTTPKIQTENHSLFGGVNEAIKTLPSILAAIDAGRFLPPLSAYIRSSSGRLMALTGHEVKHGLVHTPNADLLKRLICDLEDRRFFEHNGLDWRGLVRALIVDLRHLKVLQGGSTITQQLARTLFLSPHRSVTRKICEAVIALKLEASLTKEEILNIYCESVYLGQQTRGFESAARFIYRKPLEKLSAIEIGSLVGLLNAPNRYHPLRSINAFTKRHSHVSSKLQLPHVVVRPVNPITPKLVLSPRLERRVALELNSKQFSLSAIRAIETTLDDKVQNCLDLTLKEVSCQPNVKRVAVIVVSNKTSDILAESSWESGKLTEVSHAYEAKIQPGSTLKPFALLSALEQGFPIDTKLQSAPFKSDLFFDAKHTPWCVRNYMDRYVGEACLEDALALSDNTVFARLTELLDIQKLAELFARFSLATEKDFTPSTVLGGMRSGVSLLDLAAAYASLARGGCYIRPRLIKAIESRDRATDYFDQDQGRQITTYAAAITIQRALAKSGVATRLGIFSGKTGTTKTGSLFGGYNEDISLAIWVNFRHAPSEGDSKGVTAKKILVKFADRLLGYRSSRLLEVI